MVVIFSKVGGLLQNLTAPSRMAGWTVQAHGGDLTWQLTLKLQGKFKTWHTVYWKRPGLIEPLGAPWRLI